MQIKATANPEYRWRLALVGAMVTIFGLWFLYDAAVGYPSMRGHYEVFHRLTVEKEDFDAWRAYATEHKLDDPLPAKYNKSDTDILVQWVLGGLCLPVGLLFLFNWIRSGSWWVASDGVTLTTSWGQTVPFDSIRSVDVSRWRTKGIAVVHYEHDGRPGRLTLDDWKFLRKPTTEIYKQVDARLNPPSSTETTATAEEQASAPPSDTSVAE